MNSLYGRFGMVDTLPETIIIDKDLLASFLDKISGAEITELIELDNKYLIQYILDTNNESS